MNWQLTFGVIGGHLLLVVLVTMFSSHTPSSPQTPSPILVKTVTRPPPAPPSPMTARPQPNNTAKTADKHKKLLTQARKEIAALTPSKQATTPDAPSKTTSRTAQRAAKQEYQVELGAYLQHVLRLPEYGSVKIALTIAQDGSITAFEVLQAHSQHNRAYVEATVPVLRLPLPSKTQVLTLTLTNRR